MPSLIAEGSVSIVDLTDRGSLTGYINTNQPRVQIYDSIQDVYSPDYTVPPHLVMTPLIYMDGTPLSLVDSHLTLTWKRKIGNTEYDLDTGESVAGGILTVSRNVLNSTTPYIIYVLHVAYTSDDNGYTIETMINSDISLVTSGDIGNSVVFTLYAPEGTVFTNGQGFKTIQTSAYYGSTVITNATYKWYDYTSGVWNLIPNETGNNLIVNGADIVGSDSFKCVMTYQGMDYTDVITMIDKTDNYQCDIDSTAGNIFKNSTGNTCLVAWLFQGGIEIDEVKCPYSSFSRIAPEDPHEGDFWHKIVSDSNTMPLMRYNGASWVDVTDDPLYKYEKIYTWYRRDANGEAMDDGNPFATGKVIYVDDNSMDTKATFVCEVQDEVSGPLIATGNYTITDITDPIVSDTAPLQPTEGMIWIDTSTDTNIMKIYKDGSWQVVGASDDDKNKIFTVTPFTPYKVGDLWVNRDDGEIYVCNSARDSGNFDPDDWIPSSDYQTSQDVLDELDNFAETVVDPIAVKVDSKIETWYQTTDPAASWNTREERVEHLGDLWYNDTNGDVCLLRYYLASTNPDVFTWQEILDQNALDALAGLDHKITTYRTTTPPSGDLVDGDLWIDTDDNNKLYRYNATTSTWVDSSDNSLLNAFVTNTYTPTISTLQTYIDQKVETWFQTTDPAASWTTDQERASHIGDIWYDNTTGDVSLQRYTYALGIGYYWQQINDQTAIDAYAKASEALDTADGKRRVFYIKTSISCRYSENWNFVKQSNWNTIKNTYRWSQFASPIVVTINEEIWKNAVSDSGDYTFTYNGTNWRYNGSNVNLSTYGIRVLGTPATGSWITVTADMSHPNPPYDVGDLWAQGDTGDLLVCGTAKTLEQTYSKSDWYVSSGYSYSEYQTDVASLASQVDGKIETWFQDLDPMTYAGITSLISSNEELTLSIDADIFEYNRLSGTYVYSYDGTNWSLLGEEVTLGSQGLAIIKGTPENGDTITVIFQRPEDDVPWSVAVRSKHVGDLWYAPSTMVLKRLVDYGDNVIGWQVIQDQDAIQALADAANAQATADGKSVTYYIENILNYSSTPEITVSIVEATWNNVINEESGEYVFTYDGSKWLFNGDEVDLSYYGIRVQGTPVYDSTITVDYTFNHPNVPYDVGDLWVQGRSGTILVCKRAKSESQEYDRNDWDYSDLLKEFVTVTYPSDLEYIEGLIDNKIDTWFQTTDPSATWITVDIKTAHVGDMWYKDKDHLYTYTSDFTWYQITDTATIQVYRNAATAQDTKDGRRRVFIGNVNPAPPYDRGDLWMQGENGDILYCNVAKIEGQTFASTDFVTASKYKAYQIYTGTTAPSDTSLLWLDNTNQTSPVLKKYENGQWVVVGEAVAFHTGSTPPNPPYNAGDVWIYLDGSGNAINKICVYSRASGSYNPDDWVEGSTDFIDRGATAPSDTSKLWYNITNHILYMYDFDSSTWVEVGDLSTIADVTTKNNVSIISLNKNMSRALDSTYKLDVRPGDSNTSSMHPSLNKDLWLNGSSDGSKSPSPYTDVYGELIYAYGPAIWGTFTGYKSGKVNIGSLTWARVKNNNGARTWGYYHDTVWRKRFEQDTIVGTSGSRSELENLEYITYTGTPNSGDIIILMNYNTNTALGFVVEDYYEEYEYIEGELVSNGIKLQKYATAFDFQTDGLHIYDARKIDNDTVEVIGHSELILGSTGIKLWYKESGSPDAEITHEGMFAHRFISDGYMEVRNSIILGDYKLDCSTNNKTPGITISYSPRS